MSFVEIANLIHDEILSSHNKDENFYIEDRECKKMGLSIFIQ